jgi:formylglycine-generating enzyme required for sulfatase activity
MRERTWRPMHLVAAGVVTSGLLAICCGWPYQVGPGAPDPDAGDTGGELEDVQPYDVPIAFCEDGALQSGHAIPCPCSGDASELDAPPDSETGPIGQQTCTLEGGVGACVGCPAAVTCDGVTSPIGMICVPGGVTTLGATNTNVCPPDGCPIEAPLHTVAVSRFFFDEREVTVKRFREWWKAGHVAPKAGDVLFTAGDGTQVTWQEGWSVTEPTIGDASNGATWAGELVETADTLPINFVDWPTAAAFCTANGARLPTEAEWETAASGRVGRLFPAEAPNTRNEAPLPSMLPCEKAISGAGGADCGPPTPPSGTDKRFSADGVYDLAGSLTEWVLDVPPPGGNLCRVNCYPSNASVNPILFVPDVQQRGVRGGAWLDTEPKKLRAQAREFRPLTTKSSAIGFRCAK